MKSLFKLLFYDIPKDIWPNGAWDLVDHKEVVYINFYKVHEEHIYYSKVSHIMALIFLNLLSLFSFEIALSRIMCIIGYMKSVLKWGK